MIQFLRGLDFRKGRQTLIDYVRFTKCSEGNNTGRCARDRWVLIFVRVEPEQGGGTILRGECSRDEGQQGLGWDQGHCFRTQSPVGFQQVRGRGRGEAYRSWARV